MPPKSVNLYMNQGVVANLTECTLSSGQFSSCAPIILFNSQTNKGALYHIHGMYSPKQFTEGDEKALKDLHQEVKPDQIYILAGGGAVPKGEETRRDHVGHVPIVKEYLSKLSEDLKLHPPTFSYHIPGSQIQGMGELAKDVVLEEKSLPDEMLLKNFPTEKITGTSGLSISAKNGKLEFGPHLQNVDLSLDDTKSVAMLVEATFDTNCFTGEPNSLTQGKWIPVSDQRKELGLDEYGINTQIDFVEDIGNEYRKRAEILSTFRLSAPKKEQVVTNGDVLHKTHVGTGNDNQTRKRTNSLNSK